MEFSGNTTPVKLLILKNMLFCDCQPDRLAFGRKLKAGTARFELGEGKRLPSDRAICRASVFRHLFQGLFCNMIQSPARWPGCVANFVNRPDSDLAQFYLRWHSAFP